MIDHHVFLIMGDAITLSCHEIMAGTCEFNKVEAVAEGDGHAWA